MSETAAPAPVENVPAAEAEPALVAPEASVAEPKMEVEESTEAKTETEATPAPTTDAPATEAPASEVPATNAEDATSVAAKNDLPQAGVDENVEKIIENEASEMSNKKPKVDLQGLPVRAYLDQTIVPML